MHGVSGLLPPAKGGRSRSFAFLAVGMNNPAWALTPRTAKTTTSIIIIVIVIVIVLLPGRL